MEAQRGDVSVQGHTVTEHGFELRLYPSGVLSLNFVTVLLTFRSLYLLLQSSGQHVGTRSLYFRCPSMQVKLGSSLRGEAILVVAKKSPT